MKALNIAILGSSGAVGTEILKILEERNFPVNELKLLDISGEVVIWKNKEYTVENVSETSFDNVDITFNATNNDIAMKLCPLAVSKGSIVIDNSSAFRLDPNVPLIVPEVNPEAIVNHSGIIANPNCSTIIALTAIGPLHKYAKIKRMTVATYQAVSGAGMAGIDELKNQTKNFLDGKEVKDVNMNAFQHQIAFNVIPHIDAFEENGYTKEELKMLNEGRKILNCPELKVNTTCVRVPVFRSHSEAITIETEIKLTTEKALEILGSAPGVKLTDDINNNVYPMPIDTSDQDLVFVGRIREDISAENSLNLWVCGDQIRKGAATNAVQIAELLLQKWLV